MKKIILENLSMVDLVIDFDDDDQEAEHGIGTAIGSEINIQKVFCNGGDRETN